MTQKRINIGSSPNKGDGDPLRTAFGKINDNFDELYATDTATKYHLGDEEQFVDVELDGEGVPTGGITIQSGYNTTMPVYIKGGNALQDGVGGNVVIEAGAPPLATPEQLIQGGGPYAGTVGDIELAANQTTIESLGNTWTFDNAGKLQLPEGGDIVDSNGNSILGTNTGSWTFDTVTATTDGNIIVKAGGGTDAWASLLSNNGANSFWVDDVGAHVTSNFIEGEVTENYWKFDNNGYLNLPGGTAYITSESGSVNIQADGAPGSSGISLTAFGASIVSQADLTLSTAGGAYDWTFGTDGKLTLPTGGEIKTAAGTGDVVIEANDGTARTWTFGGDGTTQFPDNSITIPDSLSIRYGADSISIDILNAGTAPSGYIGNFTDQPTSGGQGNGMTVDYTCPAPNAPLSTVVINNPGSGYRNGDEIFIDGGNASFTLTVTRAKVWTFGADGMTTFPTGGLDPYGYDSPTLWAAVDDDFFIKTTRTDPGNDADIQLHAADDLRLFAGNGIDIVTNNVGGNGKYWTLGADGSTLFPNDTILTNRDPLSISSGNYKYLGSVTFTDEPGIIYTGSNLDPIASVYIEFLLDGSYDLSGWGGGPGFAQGDTFFIPGTVFGGTSPDNDCTITITEVNIDGYINMASVIGTHPDVTNTWNFNTDTGALELPDNNKITTSVSNPVVVETSYIMETVYSGSYFNTGGVDNISITNFVGIENVKPGWSISIQPDDITATVTYVGVYPSFSIVYFVNGEVTTESGTYTLTGPVTIPNTWAFGTDGGLTFPDDTVQATAYTGITTVAKTGATIPTTTGIPLTLGGGPAMVALDLADGTYGPFTIGGVTFEVTVASGAISGYINISSTTSYAVSAIIGQLTSEDLGATPGQTTNVDVLSVVQQTPTAIDLTKSINKLSEGQYTLADGIEGQIMYLVPTENAVGIGNAGDVIINIPGKSRVSGRYTGQQYISVGGNFNVFYPFKTLATPDITGAADVFVDTNLCTLIFTDDAWQAQGGSWAV